MGYRQCDQQGQRACRIEAIFGTEAKFNIGKLVTLGFNQVEEGSLAAGIRLAHCRRKRHSLKRPAGTPCLSGHLLELSARLGAVEQTLRISAPGVADRGSDPAQELGAAARGSER